MLKLEIIDQETHHFCISGDEPFRIESSIVNGVPIVHAYRGAKTVADQEPDLCYDGTVGDCKDQTV